MRRRAGLVLRAPVAGTNGAAQIRPGEAAMEALEAVLTRQSVAPAFLAEPAPDDAALERILAAGASAPDHGRLRPWRFIVIRGAARAPARRGVRRGAAPTPAGRARGGARAGARAGRCARRS